MNGGALKSPPTPRRPPARGRSLRPRPRPPWPRGPCLVVFPPSPPSSPPGSPSGSPPLSPPLSPSLSPSVSPSSLSSSPSSSRSSSPSVSPPLSPSRSQPLSPSRSLSSSPSRSRPLSRPLSPSRSRPLSPSRSRPSSPPLSASRPSSRPLSPLRLRPLSRPLSPSRSRPLSPPSSPPLSPSRSRPSSRPSSPSRPRSPSLSPPPGAVPASRVYDPRRPGTFFRQCFRVLERLGRGSHGAVYKVLSLDDGRVYAVKRSLRPFRGAAERRARLAEALALHRAGRHPRCAGLRRAWEERGRLYLQGELCAGGSLAAARRPLPAWRAAAYLWDLLQALRPLHARRAAHLDVKPANVLLGPGGCVLGDFGSLREEEAAEAAAEGDGRYAAPEALAGRPGPPADVFSLGLTLLECAHGRPLPATGPQWQRLRRGRLPRGVAQGLSPELRELLAAMLEPDPRRRPTAEALLHTAPLRRAGRWRGLTRLADRALRGAEQLVQDIRALLHWLWGSLWGLPHRLRGIPTTPPRAPLRGGSCPTSDWDDDDDDDDDEGGPYGASPTRWAHSAPGGLDSRCWGALQDSPTSFPRSRNPAPLDVCRPPSRSREGSPIRCNLNFDDCEDQ